VRCASQCEQTLVTLSAVEACMHIRFRNTDLLSKPLISNMALYVVRPGSQDLTLKMEVIRSSKTLVRPYRITRSNKPASQAEDLKRRKAMEVCCEICGSGNWVAVIRTRGWGCGLEAPTVFQISSRASV
jgi:hypothetical protein